MGFSQAVKSCFSNYATFSGRASRSEFWYFVLFVGILYIPLTLLNPVLGGVALLPLIVPAISVEVRRLHDLDRSGWWFWIALVPLIGFVVKLFWYSSKGSTGDNRFGADPLASGNLTGPLPSTGQTPLSITDKAEHLAKLKSLLEAGTISQPEFDRMKAELLA